MSTSVIGGKARKAGETGRACFGGIFWAALSALALMAAGCGDKSTSPSGGDEADSTYTITFNPSGGTVNPTSGKTDTSGKLASLPAPTKSGYIFDGWYTAETGGTAVTTSTVFSASTTIYARWTEESGGGGDEPDPRLFLDDGYAWVYQVEDGFMGVTQAGYIFNKDGTGFEIAFMGGAWRSYEMEWSIDGGKLVIPTGEDTDCDNDGCTTIEIISKCAYSFSGDRLILTDEDGETIELTKTQVEIGELPGGEFDPLLANIEWKYENSATGEIARWVFMFDEEEQIGMASYILEDADEEVIDYTVYFCSTSGGNLNLTVMMGSGASGTYPYTVSGNELTIDGVTYTKAEYDNSGMFKKLSKKGVKVKLQKRVGLLK